MTFSEAVSQKPQKSYGIGDRIVVCLFKKLFRSNRMVLAIEFSYVFLRSFDRMVLAIELSYVFLRSFIAETAWYLR